MNDSSINSNSESTLEKLEKQINELLAACYYLSDKTRKLEQQNQQLLDERKELINRKERASERVQSVIGRLEQLSI